MLDKIMHSEPDPFSKSGVSVPAPLESAIFRCLAKQRSQRFPSAKELREALEAIVPILPVGTAGLTLERSSGLIPVPVSTRKDTPPKANVTYEPPLQPSYQGATLALPPSEAPPPMVDESEMPTLQPPPSDEADFEAGLRPKGRRRWVALLLVAAAIAGGWMVLRSRAVVHAPMAVQAAIAPSVVESAEPKPADSAPDHPAAPPPVATIEPVATASGIDPLRLPPAASARRSGAARPAAPRPAEAPKSKAVTKVDSAGF
jgi:hypothetical protein